MDNRKIQEAASEDRGSFKIGLYREKPLIWQGEGKAELGGAEKTWKIPIT